MLEDPAAAMLRAALLAFGALHAAADRAVLARGGFVAAANCTREGARAGLVRRADLPPVVEQLVSRL